MKFVKLHRIILKVVMYMCYIFTGVSAYGAYHYVQTLEALNKVANTVKIEEPLLASLKLALCLVLAVSTVSYALHTGTTICYINISLVENGEEY